MESKEEFHVIKLIMEFANTRKEEIQKLRNISDILEQHLLCIYYWRDTDYLNHWEGEIVGFLPRMRLIKGTNKYLSEKQIYENLFTDWAITFYNDIKFDVDRIMVKEPELPVIKNVDAKNVYKFLEDFYKVICGELHIRGNIDKMFLYKLIDDLLKKYPYTL